MKLEHHKFAKPGWRFNLQYAHSEGFWIQTAGDYPSQYKHLCPTDLPHLVQSWSYVEVILWRWCWRWRWISRKQPKSC